MLYEFFQSQFLLDYWRITDVENDVVVVYVLSDHSVGLGYGVDTRGWYIVWACECVIFKIAFVHYGEPNLVRNHPVRPEVFVRGWNIAV